ncbi:hypothetical protein C6503_16665 [Candidatus Poribacteria bacterium]|nr:MAG: hypothetical protein C6503_16665 [Candidatus Poribacteria bacterium]
MIRMPIPTTAQMTLPVLQYIADGEEYRRSDIINMITEHFSLTEDERRCLSDGVTMERPLEQRGLIERPRTGYYRITTLGLEFLNRNSEEILNFDTNTETNGNPSASSSEENPGVGADNQHPEKSIDENYQQIRKELVGDLVLPSEIRATF